MFVFELKKIQKLLFFWFLILAVSNSSGQEIKDSISIIKYKYKVVYVQNNKELSYKNLYKILSSNTYIKDESEGANHLKSMNQLRKIRFGVSAFYAPVTLLSAYSLRKPENRNFNGIFPLGLGLFWFFGVNFPLIKIERRILSNSVKKYNYFLK